MSLLYQSFFLASLRYNYELSKEALLNGLQYYAAREKICLARIIPDDI